MVNQDKKGRPNRSRINLSEMKYWTKHFGISRETLEKTVERVGNSAAAVRKELGQAGRPNKDQGSVGA